jgi:hypothetical protein
MIAAQAVLSSLLPITVIAALGLFAPAARGQTKQEEAECLAAPAADQIGAEFLAPAVRQAVANGVATLMARMTAEGNDHGLAFPQSQTFKVIEFVEVPAKRVQVEHPVWEMVEVEVVEPVLESGQPTGRFAKVKRKVPGKKIGTRTVDQLVPDPNGSETMKRPKYGPGGPAAWAVNLPGLNGMALYVLAKAGLGQHPATVKHAAALAEHATEYIGLPDSTFDVAWMAAGFAALGPDSPHEKVAQRLIAKLIDGQIREKGDLEGLWGPVCVNYGYYGKLFMLGQTARQELDVTLARSSRPRRGRISRSSWRWATRCGSSPRPTRRPIVTCFAPARGCSRFNRRIRSSRRPSCPACPTTPISGSSPTSNRPKPRPSRSRWRSRPACCRRRRTG